VPDASVLINRLVYGDDDPAAIALVEEPMPSASPAARRHPRPAARASSATIRSMW
jgi:hypothetical protein